MVDYIKLKKGLNIPVSGAPQPVIKKNVIPDIVAVKPTDFRALTPKLLVKEGDILKAGSPVFADKSNPDIIFASPVSGVVSEVVRGDKRKLLEIRIKADTQMDYIRYDLPKMEAISKEEIISTLMKSGLWVAIKQRPYGIIPNPEVEPKAIFMSGFNSAPLAPDNDYCLRSEFDHIQMAINILNKLTKGGIHLGLCTFNHASTPFHKLKNVTVHLFDGPHPVGNVGVQIHHIAPVNKGETVWTIDLLMLACIGKLFANGIYDMSRMVAITGPRATYPCYVNAIGGMAMKDIAEFASAQADKHQSYQKDCKVRYISGNVLR